MCVENHWQAQVVARERVKQFQRQYPMLLPESAVKGFQTALPVDVRLLGELHLQALGQEIDMVVVGWECQGLSNAGRGQGLKHHQSALFSEVVQLVQVFQKQVRPCWYVVENIPACFDRRESVRKDYRTIKEWLGEELLLDAAQHGSRAHRRVVSGQMEHPSSG